MSRRERRGGRLFHEGASVNFTPAKNWREEAGDARGAVNGDPTVMVEKTG